MPISRDPKKLRVQSESEAKAFVAVMFSCGRTSPTSGFYVKVEGAK